MLVRCAKCYQRKYDEEKCELRYAGPANRWASAYYEYLCPECVAKDKINPFKRL